MNSFKRRKRRIRMFRIAIMIFLALLVFHFILVIVLVCKHLIFPQPSDIYKMGVTDILIICGFKLIDILLRDFEEMQKLSSGIEGEIGVQNSLSQLPKEYHILNNVEFQLDDRKAELDSLVVCPYGVFVIEVKNHKGDIDGWKDGKSWKQIRRNKKSHKTYVKEIRNPMKQLNRQIYLLSELLKDHGINVWVDGYVVFPSAHSVYSDAENAIHSMDTLNEVLSAKNVVKLKDTTIQNILYVLKEVSSSKRKD